MTEWDCPGCGCLRILHDLEKCPACGADRPAAVLVGEQGPEPVDVPEGGTVAPAGRRRSTPPPAEDGESA